MEISSHQQSRVPWTLQRQEGGRDREINIKIIIEIAINKIKDTKW